MKKRTKWWIIVIALILILCIAIPILATCGSGTLKQTQQWLTQSTSPTTKSKENTFDVRAGLKLFDSWDDDSYFHASVAAATPFGVILHFRSSEDNEIRLYEDDSEEYTATHGVFVFLPPEETLKIGVTNGYTELHLYYFYTED